MPPDLQEGFDNASQTEEIKTPSTGLNLLIEYDLPNGKVGIEAKDINGDTIWLTKCIAQKLYRCPCCQENIEIGCEHSLVRIRDGDEIFRHHHLHKPCSYDLIDQTESFKTFRDNVPANRSIQKRQARGRRSNRH